MAIKAVTDPMAENLSRIIANGASSVNMALSTERTSANDPFQLVGPSFEYSQGFRWRKFFK